MNPIRSHFDCTLALLTYVDWPRNESHASHVPFHLQQQCKLHPFNMLGCIKLFGLGTVIKNKKLLTRIIK